VISYLSLTCKLVHYQSIISRKADDRRTTQPAAEIERCRAKKTTCCSRLL